MSRKANIINNVLSMILTFGALFAVVMVCSNLYAENLFVVVVLVISAAIIAGFVNAVFHELGHLIAGKKNGFAFSSMAIWFFKWTKVGKNIVFNFTFPLDEAGYTEMIPTVTDELDKRYKKMTQGGLYGSIILMLIGAAALCVVTFVIKIPLFLFLVWAMLLPMGAYYFFGNALPMSSSGALNDGATYLNIKKGTPLAKVTLALLTFQAQLYSGKTPAQVDENLLFDLPQLPEDSPVFASLLEARYFYFLDKQDFDNAKKVTSRMLSVLDYLPKAYKFAIQTHALYNVCTFDFNEDKADELMYELEKYLNNVNTAPNVRAKLAYLLYVEKQTENAQIFYEKGQREADRCPIKGLGQFERKLFDDLKKDF